jgi:hypothetical protein
MVDRGTEMNCAEVFLQMALDRGRQLRQLPFSRLAEMTNEASEKVTLGGRKGTFSVIVEPCEDGRLLVVVQGFLRWWSWLPKLESVALDGFFKHPDGSITEMQDSDFYGYD